MTTKETRKLDQVKEMKTEAIEKIVRVVKQLQEGETEPHPLSGLVSISGIGYVSLATLERELERRLINAD